MVFVEGVFRYLSLVEEIIKSPIVVDRIRNPANTASPLCGCLSREARKKTAFSLLASATTKSRLRWMVYVEGVFRWRGLALSRGSALK